MNKSECETRCADRDHKQWHSAVKRVRTGQAFAGKHRDRRIGVAEQFFSATGIEHDNKDKRQDWVLRGFRQFDAPVCVIITYDRANAVVSQRKSVEAATVFVGFDN
jgi:hypothetical protein